jgi:MFS family permease
MTYVVMLGRISSIFFGPLGDRHGHRLLLALGNALTAAGIAVALLAQSEPAFYAAYALATFGMMAFWCGHSNYILELAPLEKRPAYISLDNMSGLPFVLAPLVGGWVADVAGGYALTFGAGIVFCLVGTALFLFYAVDPRKTLRTDIVA